MVMWANEKVGGELSCYVNIIIIICSDFKYVCEMFSSLLFS